MSIFCELVALSEDLHTLRRSEQTHMAVSGDFPGPLVGLQVTDQGEVDALTAPTLAACLSAQFAVVQVVVVDQQPGALDRHERAVETDRPGVPLDPHRSS